MNHFRPLILNRYLWAKPFLVRSKKGFLSTVTRSRPADEKLPLHGLWHNNKNSRDIFRLLIISYGSFAIILWNHMIPMIPWFLTDFPKSMDTMSNPESGDYEVSNIYLSLKSRDSHTYLILMRSNI